MKHERIGIGPEFCHDQGDALGHQASNEGNVAREAIKLGHHDGTFAKRAEARAVAN